TTIEAPEGTASPVDLQPSTVNGHNHHVNGDDEHEQEEEDQSKTEKKSRKGSIEVVVETSIRTTVEATGSETGDAARLSFVLARGETNKWIRKLKSPEGFVRYDQDGGVPNSMEVN